MLAADQPWQRPDYCAANRATRRRTRNRQVPEPATAGCDASEEREQESAGESRQSAADVLRLNLTVADRSADYAR
jgi:hypothetical protein